MKFEVGQIWRDGAGQLWRIQTVSDDPAMHYPITGKNLQTDRYDSFTVDGTHTMRKQRSREKDLVYQIIPEEYPEYFI